MEIETRVLETKEMVDLLFVSQHRLSRRIISAVQKAVQETTDFVSSWHFGDKKNILVIGVTQSEMQSLIANNVCIEMLKKNFKVKVPVQTSEETESFEDPTGSVLILTPDATEEQNMQKDLLNHLMNLQSQSEKIDSPVIVILKNKKTEKSHIFQSGEDIGLDESERKYSRFLASAFFLMAAGLVTSIFPLFIPVIPQFTFSEVINSETLTYIAAEILFIAALIMFSISVFRGTEARTSSILGVILLTIYCVLEFPILSRVSLAGQTVMITDPIWYYLYFMIGIIGQYGFFSIGAAIFDSLDSFLGILLVIPIFLFSRDLISFRSRKIFLILTLCLVGSVSLTDFFFLSISINYEGFFSIVLNFLGLVSYVILVVMSLLSGSRVLTHQPSEDFTPNTV